MDTKQTRALLRAHGGLVAMVAIALIAGCTLEDIEIPGLEGPSELGTSLRLTAVPDILTADGFSTSLIQALVRDQNGRPAPGRAIFFSIADESGRDADIGTLRNDAAVGVGTGVVVVSNSQGIAQTVYQAPARTDATANQSVLVLARPVGDDFQGAIRRIVRIQLRSAEPRLFPENPDNEPPNCSFIVQAPNGQRVNQSILFQTTSSDDDGTIVRYFWDFGNGTRADFPDVATVYRTAGTYQVTHVVTDDDGGQAACSTTLTIQ